MLVRQPIPPSLLHCLPAPPLPPATADDQQLALWITDLATSRDDCADRLARVKGLLARD